MVSESWGWNCIWDATEGHAFASEAYALRAEIAHYKGDCTDPESARKLAADRERLAALTGGEAGDGS
jgi:hypothetical protein